MTSLQFLADFTSLHEKAKKGVLSPLERSRYVDARVQFGRFAFVAQKVAHAGETLRSPLRMSKMLKAELRPDDGPPEKASTLDIASSGFAVLSPTGMRTGRTLGFTLFIPSGAGTGVVAIDGRCVVASSRPHTRAFKVSFRFENLPPAFQEQLEMMLIDAVLERLRKPM